jgi:zinc protease
MGNRTMKWLLVLVVLMLVACGPTTRESETVLLEVAGDPTVTFKVWFKVGSQNDPEGKEGLANLTGEMIADAATTSNSYEDILQTLYPLASSYYMSVDREMSVLSGRSHRDNLDEYLPLYIDAVLRPAFNADDFERIKSDMLNYLENSLRYASDEELGKAALNQLIFEGTRYAHPVVGTVQGLRSITLDDVKEFYASFYSKENATLALGGGFDAALVSRMEQAIAELPDSGILPEVTIQPEALEGRHVLLVSKPDADSSISMGFPISVSRGERDYYALWIANSWLGEHRNSASHLYQVIRERRGMNYGDYSYIEAFPNGGRRSFPPSHVGMTHQLFEIWIRTLPNEQAHFSIRAALRELETLVEQGMSEEQFELTRGFLKKYVLHFADTTSGRLGYALDDRFYGIDGDGHLARFKTMMDQISLEEVNAAIKKHLVLDNLKIALISGDAAGLKQAFGADTPSPISYKSAKSETIMAEDAEISSYPLGLSEERIRLLSVEEIFEK